MMTRSVFANYHTLWDVLPVEMVLVNSLKREQWVKQIKEDAGLSVRYCFSVCLFLGKLAVSLAALKLHLAWRHPESGFGGDSKRVRFPFIERQDAGDETLCLKESGWWKHRLWCWWGSAAAPSLPPSLRVSSSEALSPISLSTGVATATTVYHVTPCEQRPRISPKEGSNVNTASGGACMQAFKERAMGFSAHCGDCSSVGCTFEYFCDEETVL